MALYFRHRQEAQALLWEAKARVSLHCEIRHPCGGYVVELSVPDHPVQLVATLGSWAAWESFKHDHPEFVLGQLSMFPPCK